MVSSFKMKFWNYSADLVIITYTDPARLFNGIVHLLNGSFATNCYCLATTFDRPPSK